MRLFDLRGKPRVGPLWEYSTTGQLWHVRIVDKDLILAEERDPESKAVTYICLNQRDGRVVWKRGGYGEGWWIGIAGIIEGTLLLQGYANPSLPIHNGIIAVDLYTGETLWERKDLAVQGIHGENIVGTGSATLNDACVEISRTTGETVGSCDSSMVDGFPEVDKEMEFPIPFEELSERDPELVRHIAKQLGGVERTGPISVFGRGNRVAVSLHEYQKESPPAEPRYRHLVFIIDTETERMDFRQILDQDITRFNPDPFFVYRDALYCIRERRTLMAVPIGAIHDSYPAQ